MLKHLLLLAATLLLVAGCSAGGPSDSDIQGALQNHYTSAVQDQLDQMTGLFGEKRAKATVFSANGIKALSDLEVKSLNVEDVRALDNGDQLAKVVYTLRRGKHEEKLAARLNLTQLEGRWKVIKINILE